MRELFCTLATSWNIISIMAMVVSSDEVMVALQCNSSEFEYESGWSCDKTYAKLYRPYQFEPYKSDVEEAEETSPLSVNDAIDTTLQYEY